MDGSDPIEADETDLLSDAAVARLCAHPRFREAAEAFAAAALSEYEDQDPVTRWLNRDLGRASLYLGALLLDSSPEGLTFARLAEAAAGSEICSRGRVLAFTKYALASGRLTVAPPGQQPWARRRLSLTAAFLQPVRLRSENTLRATAIVAPEVAAALPRMASDAVVRQAAGGLALLLRMRPELNRNPGGPLRQIFLARDGGTRMLQHLMLNQSAERTRFMEAAPLSRAELSRRYDVSRTHVNRLLAEAEAAGALRLAAGDQVIFSEAFSKEVEAFYAGMLQVTRVVAAMVLRPS